MAELESVLFLIIGIIVGIAVIYAVMQSRVSRKAEQLYDKRKLELDSDSERRKQEMDSHYRGVYGAEFDKWKAQYQLEQENTVQEKIKTETTKALNGSRSGLKGRINEQLVPFLPEFTSKYIAADACFIGSPIDFIVFKNLSTLTSSEPHPLEIIFVEVKTGSSGLNRNEKAVKLAIENLKVSFDILKIFPDKQIDELQQPIK